MTPPHPIGQPELLLLDRVGVFSHGVTLTVLFAFSEETGLPLFLAVQRRLKQLVFGSVDPLMPFPRASSGFW